MSGESDFRLTEQRNPRTDGIDRLAPLEIVELINSEDRKVAPAVFEVREAVARAIELAEDALRAGGRMIYVGAGTSGRLGVLDASEMPPTFGTDPVCVQGVIAGGEEALTRAVEGAEDQAEAGAAEMDRLEVDADDFVLGIAASGTTPYVHGALGRAVDRGARTGFLLCTYPQPDHVERYDVVIAPLVGPEVITGSTRMKAGTATKLVLNTLSSGVMIRLGKVFGNLMVDLRASNRKLQDRSERILMEMCDVDRDGARQMLEDADGSVKLAIVMYWTGADADHARQLLRKTGGRLGDLQGTESERDG
ncbi:MAG: N-acetylmuramic acid 6-phosphate etherase [Gemmatimonadota bacterium]|jgi:N-acetylmuramic acid 6-phosphate etherase|nr:N-acetylmuramic acid 6-phosphate etherase [Gemmatimonadota bacterium]